MRQGLLLAAVLALAVTPAVASQIPAGCSTDGVGVDVQKSATTIKNGDTVTYTGTFDNSPAANVCDAALIVIRAFCPDPQGQPTVLFGTLISVPDLPHATPTQQAGSFKCVINLASGVHTAIARVTLAGILHDNPIADDLLSISKDLSVLIEETPPPPPPPPVSQIPTLSEWAMIGLGVFLVGMGALTLRKRRQA